MEEAENGDFPGLQISLLKLNYEAIIGRARRLSSNFRLIAEIGCNGTQKSAGIADALITPAGDRLPYLEVSSDRVRTSESRSEYELFALKSIKRNSALCNELQDRTARAADNIRGLFWADLLPGRQCGTLRKPSH